MKMLRFFLTVILFSFGFSILPMEYNSQKNDKEEQKESTEEQNNVPSLVDLCLDAIANKILYPLCKQSTKKNFEKTRQEISAKLTQLPNELHEPLKTTFTQQFVTQELSILGQRKVTTLPDVRSWNTQTNMNFQAIIDENNTIHIFDADTEQTTTITPNAKVTVFALAATQPILACALEDGRIQLWDLKNSSCIKTITANLVDNLPFVDLIISPTLKYLAASNRERQAIRMWNLKTNKELNHAITNKPETDMLLMQFTPANALLVKFQPYIGGDMSIYHQLWNEYEDDCITLPKVSYATLDEIGYSPKGKYIACKYHRTNNALSILDTTTGALKKFNFEHDEKNKKDVIWFDSIYSFKFSANSKHVMVASSKYLFIFDLMNNSIKKIPMPIINEVENLPNAEYDHNKIVNLNNRYFVTIGDLEYTKFGYTPHPYPYHMIFVWDITTGSCIKTMPINLTDLSHYLSVKNKIIIRGSLSTDFNSYFNIFNFYFKSHYEDALDLLPYEYALKDTESDDQTAFWSWQPLINYFDNLVRLYKK